MDKSEHLKRSATLIWGVRYHGYCNRVQRRAAVILVVGLFSFPLHVDAFRRILDAAVATRKFKCE